LNFRQGLSVLLLVKLAVESGDAEIGVGAGMLPPAPPPAL
jgi:hypothetical protein